MGTEVLRPQTCLIEKISTPPAMSFSRRRNYFYYGNPCSNYNSNPRSSQKPFVRSEKKDQRRKFDRSEQSPSVSKKSSIHSNDLRYDGLKMEKVTILRRGELLNSNKEGTGSKIVTREARIVETNSPAGAMFDVYAGSAFAFSPAPSSLPLPSFSKKKQVSIIVDDSATRDLRRLLRLD